MERKVAIQTSFLTPHQTHQTQTEDIGVGAMTIIFDLDGTLSYRGWGLGRGKPIEDAAGRLQELGRNKLL